MKTISGHDVKIFTDNIEQEALDQINRLVSIDVFSDKKIRIMPDVHAGAGCVIGFTGDLGDKVIPNIVGVDIGCGILVQPFTTNHDIDFHELNEFILKNIPSGHDFRDDSYVPLTYDYRVYYKMARELTLKLKCYRELKEVQRIHKSIGSLGGGNHFIEIDVDDQENKYLLIHTGSRNLGKQVADIYQKLAVKCMSGWDELIKKQNEIIEQYKREGRRQELQKVITELHQSFKSKRCPISSELAYLESSFRDDYLHDMKICQEWARINRNLIRMILIDYFDENYGSYMLQPYFESVHNYIDDDNIIRKGAISAYYGQRVIIPLNMRDGAIIGLGKGNEDWNYSAPHGAGRIMSRTKAFDTINLDDFKKSMYGIYSESVVNETIDESPMAYKPASEIIENIQDTVEVSKIIKPIYNFKATK